MYMNLDHVTSDRFVPGRDIHCEFDYWPLAVSMPQTKACPQCKAAVPVRWKTCEHCDHVFRSKQKAECTAMKLILVNTQVQSHALLHRGFGTSVPFIISGVTCTCHLTKMLIGIICTKLGSKCLE